MARTRYRHIFLDGANRTRGFTSPGSRGREPKIPERDPETHSARLMNRLQAAWNEADERQAVAHVERIGTYIVLESDPNHDRMKKSLEDMKAGIRLLNVRREGPEDAPKVRATVYVPHEQRNKFLRKLHAYATEIDGRSGKPKNAKLVNSIGDIRRSVLESFWRPEERVLIPGEDAGWVEVWLRVNEQNTPDAFKACARENHIEIAEEELRFPERTVLLIRANRSQLEHLIEASDDIAEFRFAKEVASFFIELENSEQMEWVQELLDRTTVDEFSDVAVCILDH